jgi:hypothetical protein
MQLHQLEELFWNTARRRLQTSAVEAEFRAHGALDARQRMAIYRDMYWARQVAALRDVFPKLVRLLGADRFERVACDYIEAHPSVHPALEQLGRSLPEFCARDASLPARASDVAAIDWARCRVLLAPEADRVASTADISVSAFSHSRLCFVPALLLTVAPRSALELWENPERSSDAAALEESVVDVVVWRQGYAVRHLELDADEARALRTALTGAALAPVCDSYAAVADPVVRAHTALSGWFRRGWVSSIREE